MTLLSDEVSLDTVRLGTCGAEAILLWLLAVDGLAGRPGCPSRPPLPGPWPPLREVSLLLRVRWVIECLTRSYKIGILKTDLALCHWAKFQKINYL